MPPGPSPAKNGGTMRMGKLSVFVVALLLGCGGSQNPANSEPLGDTHVESEAEGLNDQAAPAGLEAGEESTTGEPGEAVPEEAPAVTFRLVNTAKEDLVFSVDKGWQPVIFAFSGEPPNAKSILMFPKFCTASCDAAAEERCPYCPEPENVREVKASEQRQVVAAGSSIDVPWDGEVFVYEKTRGKQDGRSKRCDCYRKQAVPPETYTVRACGLRLTKTAKRSTKYQCVDGSMSFPAEGPQVVTLEFPAP